MAKKRILIFLSAAVLWVLSAFLSLSMGAAGNLWNGSAGISSTIFWLVRIPRTAACLLAGGALAVSGGVIQSVLHNKLASPGIIGVNAGAGLAVTICCALDFYGGWAVAGSAFLGAMIAALLVMGLAGKIGASRSTVILCGVAVNALLNACAEGIAKLIPEVAMYSVDFRVGGFGAVSHVRLIPAGILIVIALAAVLTLCNDLDILALGGETAQSLGMNVKWMRTLFLILSAMLAGAAVSFAGLLGFVGLIVPHAVRAMVGEENRFVLPLCALGGGCLVTLCDLACRLVFAPYELPVGIGMSVLGCPFFLMLLWKEKGGRHA